MSVASKRGTHARLTTPHSEESDKVVVKDNRVQGKAPIPDIVIGRLPVYLRTLRLLADEGREVTSSQELGEHLGISSAQIRKDLSHFGEFGKQGTGYNIAFLCRQLQKILNVDRIWSVILVGAGSLGTAIANYQEFESSGFRIVTVLDEDPQKIGGGWPLAPPVPGRRKSPGLS
jgi:redox-sensing transcriptional repressor